MFIIQWFNESLDYCKQCARLEQDTNAETYSDMSRCVFEMKKKDLSETIGLQYANRAIEINPKCANAFLNLGNLQHQLGFPDKAQADYETALSLNPEFPGALSNLGNLLYEKNDFEEACF